MTILFTNSTIIVRLEGLEATDSNMSPSPSCKSRIAQSFPMLREHVGFGLKTSRHIN